MTHDLKQYAERAPVKYRRAYAKALKGTLPPRSAIKVKCLECVCWQRMEGGTDQIGGCLVRSCPLWSLRPYQGKPRASATSTVEASPEGL
jgi:hypothetical protein